MPNDKVDPKPSPIHRLTRFLADRFDPRSHLGLGLTVNVVVFGLAVWALSGLLDAVLDNDLIVRFDAAVEKWFHSHSTPLGLGIFNAITQLGSPVVYVVMFAVAIYLWRKREMLLLWTWLGANLGGKAVQFVIKSTVHRSRPQYAAEYLHGRSYSFPSGHTMGATICYLLLAYIVASRPGVSNHTQRAVYIAAAAIVLAVAFSRLYLGLH